MVVNLSQVFTCGHLIAIYINVISIDLLTKIHESCKPNPVSQLVQGVHDFKAWMDPTQGGMENHAKYHVFRFTKGSSNAV